MMDFSNIKSIVIPEGEVAVVARNGEILWQKSRLPLAYQEVEYLQSTGTQWIDTGFIAKSTMPSIKMKFRSTQYKSYYIGVHNNGSRVAGITKSAVNTVAVVGYDRGTTSVEVNQDAEWNEVFIDRKSKTVTADGATVSMNGSFGWYSTNQVEVPLFGQKVAQTNVVNCSKVSIAYCELYDDDMTLFRNFIPCYRKSDGEAGMYDLVTDTFFTNSGTGKFLYG